MGVQGAKKQQGALKVRPLMAAMTLSTSVLLAFSTAGIHMWMPIKNGPWGRNTSDCIRERLP